MSAAPREAQVAAAGMRREPRELGSELHLSPLGGAACRVPCLQPLGLGGMGVLCGQRGLWQGQRPGTLEEKDLQLAPPPAPAGSSPRATASLNAGGRGRPEARIS